MFQTAFPIPKLTVKAHCFYSGELGSVNSKSTTYTCVSVRVHGLRGVGGGLCVFTCAPASVCVCISGSWQVRVHLCVLDKMIFITSCFVANFLQKQRLVCKSYTLCLSCWKNAVMFVNYRTALPSAQSVSRTFPSCTQLLSLNLPWTFFLGEHRPRWFYDRLLSVRPRHIRNSIDPYEEGSF